MEDRIEIVILNGKQVGFFIKKAMVCGTSVKLYSRDEVTWGSMPDDVLMAKKREAQLIKDGTNHEKFSQLQ